MVTKKQTRTFGEEMKKEIPITEHEKLAKAVDDFKKEILKTWFGKFMLWTLAGFRG